MFNAGQAELGCLVDPGYHTHFSPTMDSLGESCIVSQGTLYTVPGLQFTHLPTLQKRSWCQGQPWKPGLPAASAPGTLCPRRFHMVFYAVFDWGDWAISKHTIDSTHCVPVQNNHEGNWKYWANGISSWHSPLSGTCHYEHGLQLEAVEY